MIKPDELERELDDDFYRELGLPPLNSKEARIIDQQRHNYFRRVLAREVYHTGMSFKFMVEPGNESTYHGFQPDINFKIKYLLIFTSGFWINELRVSNTCVLDNVDGDTYYRTNWDRLERLGELGRVRLDCPTLTPANRLILRVKHTSYKQREFRASIIGQGLTSY